MNVQEVSSMIYSFKEKITDKEYKDIMDLLMIINRKQKENGVYIFEYIKQKHKLIEEEDYDKKILVNTIYSKKKKCLIKFNTNRLGDNSDEKIDNIIKEVNNGNLNYFKFFFNVPTNYNNENIFKYKILDAIHMNGDKIEYLNNDVLIRYKNIIPLSFTPYKTNNDII